jgi:hypothetical protein
VKKPKAKPAGSSAAEGGGEGDAAGEKDEGDGDEVRLTVTFSISRCLARSNYFANCPYNCCNPVRRMLKQPP